MKSYNIVLFGGSNAVLVDGLQKGLQGNNIKLINLALGGTTSIQNLYELKREKNQQALQEADLIITESSSNEIGGHNAPYQNLSLDIIYRNLILFYEELVKYNKPVVDILLPRYGKDKDIINNIHIMLANRFSFYVIDMYEYYQYNNLRDFHYLHENAHPHPIIMNELGKNIIKNISYFNKISKSQKKDYRYLIEICESKELIAKKGKITFKEYKNSMYCENITEIDTDCILRFPEKYYGYKILAIHTWNRYDGVDWKILPNHRMHVSDISIKNEKKNILKSTSIYNSVSELQTEFVINKDTFITCSIENKNYTEYNWAAHSWLPNAVRHNTLDLIGFLIFFSKEHIIFEIDFSTLKKEKIKYDLSFLIPPIKMCQEIFNIYSNKLSEQISFFKKTIKEKNELIIKQNSEIKKYQSEIVNHSVGDLDSFSSKCLSHYLELSFQTKYGTAKSRIQNQLSYKLGQAMIVNSKSFLGYIKMPFVLSYIKDKHTQEQKIYQEKIKKDPSLKLPPLESYPDYKEALKEKECLTYKLGEALIKANKTWYKGGYVKLIFEIGKLKKEVGKDKK
ncbi:SGNH/GDSL hydrolase family protein [Campylobacter lari]|uniref:SGNH/GDSL hydrolase family protein n=1 Tax=Campylobacter lari TaxID=201 RepID=UPI00372A733E